MVPTLDQPNLLFLNLPAQLNLQVTPKQFAELAKVNRELRLERTATGALIVNPPTGGETGKRNLSIAGQLSYWYENNDNLGEAFDSSTGFELPNGAQGHGSCRTPDASWVARERWEALTPAQREGFIPLCPDFVVELRSKTDSLKKLQEKMQEYQDNGTRLGWLIDPQHKRVEIYRPG